MLRDIMLVVACVGILAIAGSYWGFGIFFVRQKSKLLEQRRENKDGSAHR